MARSFYVEGQQLYEESARDYFVGGVQFDGAPTSIPDGITSGPDDAQVVVGTGYADNTTSLLLGNAFGQIDVLFRFNNLTIPVGATITSAVLNVVESFGNDSSADTFSYYLFDEDSATMPTDETDYSGRSITSAITGNFGVMAAGVHVPSPDLSSILQTVVNRGGWASGNSVVVNVRAPSATANSYFLEAYDSNPLNAATFVVTYTVGGGGTVSLLLLLGCG